MFSGHHTEHVDLFPFVFTQQRHTLIDKTKADRGHFAVALFFEFVSHLLTFIQTIKTGILNRCNMYENITFAFIRIDKAVTFLGVKPLDSTLCHFFSLQPQL